MKITQRTTKRVTYELLGSDIAKLLNIPEGASGIEVTVQVPSGGDYSGMTLDVDEDMPVVVSFSTVGGE